MRTQYRGAPGEMGVHLVIVFCPPPTMGPFGNTFTSFLPTASLLHSSKLLRENSASLLYLAFWLPKLRGKGSSKAPWSPLSHQKLHGPNFLSPKLCGVWSLLFTASMPGFLNPSDDLPLKPHFQLLPQSATLTSIPLFFQPFLAAIVSLGRCGPRAWSKSS